MDNDFDTLTNCIRNLKKSLYSLVDEYNRCIHEVTEETSLHEKFPPLTAEELEEKVKKICEEKCNFYIERFYSVDKFFKLIVDNEDISNPSQDEHLTFFSKLWLGDYYDLKGWKGIKALEEYTESLDKDKENIVENSFKEIFYNHF